MSLRSRVHATATCSYLAALLTLVSWCGPSHAQSSRDLFMTDGQVRTVVESEGKLYIGGQFTRLGPPTGAVAPLNPTTGAPLWLPKIMGNVKALAPDGTGGCYVGGQLVQVNGVPVSNLLHIYPDQSLEWWTLNGPVNALVLSGGKLYVGGLFSSIEGVTRNNIAAIDVATGSVTAWNPNANAEVYALAVNGNTVYAGGAFGSIGGATRSAIAALDASVNTNNATAWNPNSNATVYSLAVSGSIVYAGGTFSIIAGQARGGLAALDALTNTNNATPWNPNPSFSSGPFIRAIAVSGSTVYVGGRFDQVGGQARASIAALDATLNTNNATAWNPSAFGDVYAIVLSGTTVYIAGSFPGAGGQPRSGVAALDATVNTNNATSWDPSPWNPHNDDESVHALASDGSAVWAGGNFSTIGGTVYRYNIAALDKASGEVTAWDPFADGPVTAIEVAMGRVYVGGVFTSIGGQLRNRLAALDPAIDTNNALSWNPNVNGAVFALAVRGGEVYAGGLFTAVGGMTRNRIAAIDAITGAVKSWDPNANNTVSALVVTDNTVYVGGSFTIIGTSGGSPALRNRIAALDPTNDVDTAKPWNPDANGPVYSLLVSGGVYAGGDFTTIGGQTRNRIAQLISTINTNNATDWNPNVNGDVYALATDGNSIYMGGLFSSVGGQPRRAVAAVDRITATPRSWAPAFGDGPLATEVHGLEVSEGVVYAGGSAPRNYGPDGAHAPQLLGWSGAPTLRISGRSVPEGNLGTSIANLMVRLTPAQPYVVTVNYATSDGSATAGSDYVATSGMLIFQPGETSQLIPVTVNGDLVLDGPESFTVTLSNSSGPPILASVAQGNLLDDDALRLVASNLYTTDGIVNAVASAGNTIYIGGSFGRVGPACGGGVPVDIATGQAVWLPKVNGNVSVVVPDGAGGWYVGGGFNQIGGVSRPGLARILANHTVSSWIPAWSGGVEAIAVNGATIFVAGSNRIAALDATTGGASTWDPQPNGGVYALAVSGGILYAAGDFTRIGGALRDRVAALSLTTAEATPWNPGANAFVRSLAVNGSNIILGGNFTNVGGQVRNRLAAVGIADGLPTAWNPNLNSTLDALLISGSTAYVGGHFTAVAGVPRNFLAAIDMGSGLPLPWNPNPDSYVNALAVSGGTVYAGGNFTTIGGQSRRWLAAVDASGTATSWNPAPNSLVHALDVIGSEVFVGGQFSFLGGVPRNNIAALNASTGVATSWDPNANGAVNALVVDGNTVYAGGEFTSMGAVTRNRIAALDATVATNNATAWNPNAQSGSVLCMALSGSTLYVGGSFSQVGGGAGHPLIAALSTSTGSASAWTPNPTGGGGTPARVSSIAVSGNIVYVGGNFSNIGGQPRNYVAALDATINSNMATAWNPNSSGEVLCIAPTASAIYVGGLFGLIGGQDRWKIAALNPSTGAPTAWDPGDPNDGTSFAQVNNITVNGSTVYVGGRFQFIGGQQRSAIAALDANLDTDNATAWDPSAGGSPSHVKSIAIAGSTIYVGGSFTTISSVPHANLAALIPLELVDVPNTPPASLEFVMHAAPNPSRGPVQLHYMLPEATRVRIAIYDVTGRLVANVVNEMRPAGRHLATWNPIHANGASPAGIYLARIEAGSHRATKRIVRMR